jgi:hypothetical protein
MLSCRLIVSFPPIGVFHLATQYAATQADDADLELMQFFSNTLKTVSTGASADSYSTRFSKFADILLGLAHDARQPKVSTSTYSPTSSRPGSRRPHSDWKGDFSEGRTPSLAGSSAHSISSTRRPTTTQTQTQNTDQNSARNFAPRPRSPHSPRFQSLPPSAAMIYSDSVGPNDYRHEDLDEALGPTWGTTTGHGASTTAAFPSLNDFLVINSFHSDGGSDNVKDPSPWRDFFN